jgi:CheY-like chemotaxis protein
VALSSVNSSGSLIVLVVEDEFLVREHIAQYLQGGGCVVLEADTAEQAIAMCKAGAPVDVVFTDIQLNGSASGWDVAETFRTARPGIAVVYTSGNSTDRSRRVPDSLFFDKPYNTADILEACRRFCPR